MLFDHDHLQICGVLLPWALCVGAWGFCAYGDAGCGKPLVLAQPQALGMPGLALGQCGKDLAVAWPYSRAWVAVLLFSSLFGTQEIQSKNSCLHEGDGLWRGLQKIRVILHPEVRTVASWACSCRM